LAVLGKGGSGSGGLTQTEIFRGGVARGRRHEKRGHGLAVSPPFRPKKFLVCICLSSGTQEEVAAKKDPGARIREIGNSGARNSGTQELGIREKQTLNIACRHCQCLPRPLGAASRPRRQTREFLPLHTKNVRQSWKKRETQVAVEDFWATHAEKKQKKNQLQGDSQLPSCHVPDTGASCGRGLQTETAFFGRA